MRNFFIVGLICLHFPFATAQRERQTTSAVPTSRNNPAPALRSTATPAPHRSDYLQPSTSDAAAARTTTAKRRIAPRTQGTYPAPTAPKLEMASPTTPDKTPVSDILAGQRFHPSPVNAAPDPTSSNVQWLTLEEVEERSKTVRKKIFIDIYTSWCGWCKRMDETTFSDPAVIKYLNDNYYAVKLDAEQQQDITFKGKTYQYKKMGKGGYNELAIELLNNRLSFPTVVFLNEDFEIIQSLATYLDAPKFETIINYFATDNHKKTPWEAYERNFVPQSLHHRKY